MATTSKNENINVSEISKILYEKSLNLCKNPETRESGKESLLTNLHEHLSNLIEAKSYEEIFDCFEEAQSIFGEDADFLNILAVALNRLEKPIEALNYLNKALQLSPNKVKIIENRENIINQWVPRWHFSMLNDENRNSLYKRAITEKIQNGGHKTVLDIGTGTGLLSIYCHQAGAKEIFACEMDEIMYKIAENVFRENNIPVKLLPEHSINLCLEELQMSSGFDLIVTEIFDCGAFGEGALSTLKHAKEKLLKENGKILPEFIKMYVVGVDKINVREKHDTLESAMENSIYLKNTILTPKMDGPYEPIEQICNQMTLVTESVHAFTVDFNDFASLKAALNGDLDAKIQLSCLEDGHLEGFLVYFELQLNEGNVLRNFDFDGDSKSTRCWDPILFPLNYPMDTRKYQILSCMLSCKDGILRLIHDYDNINERNLKIDPHVFLFLTDDEFIYELEYNVGKALKKNRKNFEQLADFLPFPHIGINFLKENKVTKLYCLGNLRELVKTIAEWNCIPETAIEFVDDFETLINAGVKFDLIIINPLTDYGTLNEEHLRHYETLKSFCLSSTGTMFPHKVDLCCKLIYSPWLDCVTRVRNNELAQLGIEKYINQYSTKHQFEFLNFDSLDLSDVFTMSTVQFNSKLYEKEAVINLNSSQTKANGILYFYKIFFMSNSIPILTNRKKSFCKMNCFVQSVNVDGKSSLVINFVQDEFAFRCTIQQ